MKFLKLLHCFQKINDVLPSESSTSIADGRKLYKRLNQVTFAVGVLRIKCEVRKCERAKTDNV